MIEGLIFNRGGVGIIYQERKDKIRVGANEGKLGERGSGLAVEVFHARRLLCFRSRGNSLTVESLELGEGASGELSKYIHT